MNITQEQKDKITGIIRKEILFEEKTPERVEKTLQQIKEVVGSDWFVMYVPADKAKDPQASAHFVLGNKERVYDITLNPNKWGAKENT